MKADTTEYQRRSITDKIKFGITETNSQIITTTKNKFYTVAQGIM